MRSHYRYPGSDSSGLAPDGIEVPEGGEVCCCVVGLGGGEVICIAGLKRGGEAC